MEYFINEHEDNPDYANGEGLTPLITAASHGQVETVKLLINKYKVDYRTANVHG